MGLDNNRNGETPTFSTLVLGIFPWIPSLISTGYSVLRTSLLFFGYPLLLCSTSPFMIPTQVNFENPNHHQQVKPSL